MEVKDRVHITAFIAGNLGDDLFIKILCERYGNTDFVLAGPGKFKVLFKDITNLNYICDDTFGKKVTSRLLNYRRKLAGKKSIYRDKSVNNRLAKKYKIHIINAQQIGFKILSSILGLRISIIRYTTAPLKDNINIFIISK